MNRICKKCGIEKDISCFSKDSRNEDKISKYCRDCKNYMKRDWDKNNKEHIQEYNNTNIEAVRKKGRKHMQKARSERPEYYKSPRFKEMQRGYSLKRIYGITPEDYNNIFLKQDGKCAICGVHQSEFKRPLVVDHNHITGEIRSLLCNSCNSVIGFSYESIDIMRKAIEYLSSFTEYTNP